MLVRIDKDILIHLEEHKCITIRQCQRIFYRGFNDEDGYTYARRKLRHLEKEGLLKSYDNKITKQKVYYTEKKLSAHDLFRLDFYAYLIGMGATVYEFRKTPHYLNNTLIPDALFVFSYDNLVFITLLEVDFGHCSDMYRMQMYEKLYKEADWRKEFYGRFPQVVIMGMNPLKYCSNNFTVIPVTLELQGISKVLSLSQ